MAEKKTETDQLSFEDALRRLEEIVRKLESGDAPLKESIALYEEAQKLKRHCEKELETAEERISKLELDKDGQPADEIPF